MIKSLFLIAALLLPGIAYGANPSAPFSDQVVPAHPPRSIACDIGPNAASIPAAAQKAGFTHCVANFDFTSNTTDANGWNMSNPSTYVAECGGHTANNTIWHIAFHNTGDSTLGIPYKSGAAPCSRFAITTDPTYGNQALYLRYLPSDGPQWTTLEASWPAGEDGEGPCASSGWPLCAGGPNGQGLPQQSYLQINWRITPATLQLSSGGATIVTDWWMDNCNGCVVNTASEIDFFEMNTGNCSGSNCNMQGGFEGTNFSNVTEYTPTGWLMTSSDNVTTYYCGYVGQTAINSGLASHCNSHATNQDAPNLGPPLDKVVAHWVGGNDCFGHPGCEINGAELYIQNEQIWMCPNYWTTACLGTVVTSDNSGPDPWYQRLAKWIEESIIGPAKADGDVFDAPYQGLWKCPDGRFQVNIFGACFPAEFKEIDWWKSCVPGRSDCVWSDSAFIGWEKNPRPRLGKRGPGYCYTEQPYTCSADGKLPQ